MGVFENNLRKNANIFFKGNVWFRGALNFFHKTTPTYSKMVFGYGGLFVTLNSMQLFINKL
jgi:hypothetical protein